MWRKIFFISFIISSFGVYSEAFAADSVDSVLRCDYLTQQQKQDLSNETKFTNFITSLGLKRSIQMSNGTQAMLDKSLFINKCWVVYGDPDMVETHNPQKQDYKYIRDSNGAIIGKEYLYLGFTAEKENYLNNTNRGLYPNIDYPESPTDYNYINVAAFYQNPWDRRGIIEVSGGNYDKPDPRTDVDYTGTNFSSSNYFKLNTPEGYNRAYNLGRAVDRFCLMGDSSGNCENTHGAIGYFDDVSKYSAYPYAYVHQINGEKLGDNLSQFAVIHDYPTKYSFGSFTLYRYDTATDTIKFATLPMASYENPFSQPDLSIASDFTITPDDPKSSNTEISQIKIKVLNHSMNAMNNVKLTYGFGSYNYCMNIGSLAAASNTNVPSEKVITIINGQFSCNSSASEPLKYPVTNQRDSDVQFKAWVNEDKTNPANELNWDNNKRSWDVKVQNPNAWLDVVAIDKNNVYLRVHNEMINHISSPCKVSSNSHEICLGGTSPSKVEVKVYDTKWTDTESDDEIVAHITDADSNRLKYSAVVPTDDDNQYTQIAIHSLIRSKLGDNFDEPLNAIKYRIDATIPHYAGEVYFEGNQKYSDNSDQDFVIVLPNLPDFTVCKDAPAPYITVTSGTDKPHKMCAGQYPKFPSTNVEGGMGSYFFTNYQFFPLPLPKYELKNVGNHFQEFTYVENNATLGDTNTFLYYPTGPKTPTHNVRDLPGPYIVDDHYTYRGRMMPVGADFKFKVEHVGTDNHGNEVAKTLAIGSVRYDIPASCFKVDRLDFEHKMGCDSILFFMPNDTAKMFERPADYPSNQKVDYDAAPITNTKVPLLNSGKHRFSLDAQEKQEYYYQHDDGDYVRDTNGTNIGPWQYRWSNVQKYGDFN